MNDHIPKLEAAIISLTPPLMVEIQSKLGGPYIDCVVKGEWPKETSVARAQVDFAKTEDVVQFGFEERTYRLKSAAIQSPYICLEDIRFGWAFEEVVKNIERLFVANLRWVWKNAFRRDIMNTITTRRLARHAPAPSDWIVDGWPRRVNFLGKEIQPFMTGSGKSCINPKYKRAATQYVEFHPDIVHFLFPDLENWAGKLQYRNIPHAENNPDGNLAFFRVVMNYAAKPVRPDLGSVTTVPPPGFRGTVWYWAWKLLRYVP